MDERNDGEAGEERAEERRLRQSELLISYVLRGGVLLSAGIIGLGVILFYVRYLANPQSIDTRLYPHTLAAVASGIASGNPLAIIVLGLLILLATPTLRVAVSIVTFALERDVLYTAITALVLLILLASYLLGGGGA